MMLYACSLVELCQAAKSGQINFSLNFPKALQIFTRVIEIFPSNFRGLVAGFFSELEEFY